MARERKNRRHTRRRGRGGFLYRAVSVAVILAALLVGSAVFFRINSVEISGNSRYSYDDILNTSGIQMGENMFAINKFKVADKILTELPYVSSVTIRRNLPDTLVVTVQESDAAACFQTDGGWAVINSAGKVMSVGDSQEGAPVTGATIAAPEVGSAVTAADSGQSSALSDLLSLLQALEDQGALSSVNALDLSSTAAIRVTYQDTVTARFNYSSDYGYDVRAFLTAMNYVTAGKKTTVDLTYEDGVHIFSE